MTPAIIIENYADRAVGIADAFASLPLAPRIVRPYLGQPLPAVDDAAIVVISGGPMSVNDAGRAGLEYLTVVMMAIQRAIDRGVPCLGICLGHQLLAKVLGGSVVKMPRPDIGIRRIERCGAGAPRELDAFEFHYEHVPELPRGCLRTFTSAACPIEGFAHESLPIAGVQFHPEVTSARAQAILMPRATVSRVEIAHGAHPSAINLSAANAMLHELIAVGAAARRVSGRSA